MITIGTVAYAAANGRLALNSRYTTLPMNWVVPPTIWVM